MTLLMKIVVVIVICMIQSCYTSAYKASSSSLRPSRSLLSSSLLVSKKSRSITSLKLSNRTILVSARLVMATSALLIVTTTTNIINSIHNNNYSASSSSSYQLIQSVNADSTGKFSTKLTARKRYYPRIVEGVKEFNNLFDKKGEKTILLQFTQQENIDKFKRALSLYGASLRKGEVPDEVSRTAETKTLAFIAEVEKLEKSSNVVEQLNKCRVALDDYLAYAKLDASTTATYK